MILANLINNTSGRNDKRLQVHVYKSDGINKPAGIASGLNPLSRFE